MQESFRVQNPGRVFHHVKRISRKKPNHLQRGRKNTGQNSTQFTLKTLHKPEANFLNLVQGTYKKHTANIIPKVKD